MLKPNACPELNEGPVEMRVFVVWNHKALTLRPFDKLRTQGGL